ncbi:phosphopantetheine-binding protein [Amycolatopsis australiensis]|uniref:Acyl carrier protein n=1 Tax=Amycolatopsis australiensis TaxID=546364 RepID=A0A1K1RFX4_9PSEU|nr:phosphopantetheine-binding protein [Amycolatopsis australiensis]SFW70683.1 acyl carrier protein [Amycolatopsis australiensis]
MSTTEEQIRTLLVEKLRVKPEALASDVTFEDLSFDSLVLIELSLLLEKRFGVRLAEGELTGEHTIAGAAELVELKEAAVR